MLSADSIGLHRVSAYLGLMNKAAPGAPQGPVLESGTGCGSALDLHAQLASGTTRPCCRARREGGRFRIGHARFPLNGGSVIELSVTGNAQARVGDNLACALCGVECWSILLTRAQEALHERTGLRCRVEKDGVSFDAK
jgi:hypothetical protein